MPLKRIAAINDISGFGRCSLTVAIPVISALGVQVCPFPTAVLTAQTGFEHYHMTDLTGTADICTDAWQKQGVSFDAIFTGFLASEEQVRRVVRLIDTFKTENTLLLVDPVMADDGEIYDVFDENLCNEIIRLALKADVITPNLTEFCMITGLSYDDLISGEYPADAKQILITKARELVSTGLSCIYITGIRLKTPDETPMITTAVITKETAVFLPSRAFEGSFSGTGDLFASVICGGLTRGMDPVSAARLALRFLDASISETVNAGTDPKEGVIFEPHLSLLWKDI